MSCGWRTNVYLTVCASALVAALGVTEAGAAGAAGGMGGAVSAAGAHPTSAASMARMAAPATAGTAAQGATSSSRPDTSTQMMITGSRLPVTVPTHSTQTTTSPFASPPGTATGNTQTATSKAISSTSSTTPAVTAAPAQVSHPASGALSRRQAMTASSGTSMQVSRHVAREQERIQDLQTKLANLEQSGGSSKRIQAVENKIARDRQKLNSLTGNTAKSAETAASAAKSAQASPPATMSSSQVARTAFSKGTAATMPANSAPTIVSEHKKADGVTVIRYSNGNVVRRSPPMTPNGG
jgi:hypothetical protein